ncbi:carbohydrate ABC transporter membrane protein 1 (CUT1 family) [Haloactinopolyspora alba]|uniref:Carbohydrate ABC transporter membrane protein 1 (CUT1 family) n=2 Tax=Haloactinopolyspora alba TaxID=648780 RepID=A0A2P8E718_9ACTN|nr:carbohydrate ABC transporter membrane protein 1 (CUT1 family) [Haloactinopolyspora alba]
MDFRVLALLPLASLLLLLVLFPLIELFRLALSTVQLEAGGLRQTYTGMDNLRTALGDQVFGVALRNTLIFVGLTTLAQILLGTALAVFVQRAGRIRRLAQSLLLWPIVVAPVVVSVVWWLILNSRIGALNAALDAVGLPEQGWLSSTLSLFAVMVVDVWHWTPVVFLIVFAAVQGADPELREAALVDGANERQVFRYITLPQILPAIGAAALIRAIGGVKTFDEVFILTGGGPGISSEIVSTFVHRLYSDQLEVGYASMVSVFTILIVVVFAVGIWALRRFFQAIGGAA